MRLVFPCLSWCPATNSRSKPPILVQKHHAERDSFLNKHFRLKAVKTDLKTSVQFPKPFWNDNRLPHVSKPLNASTALEICHGGAWRICGSRLTGSARSIEKFKLFYHAKKKGFQISLKALFLLVVDMLRGIRTSSNSHPIRIVIQHRIR